MLEQWYELQEFDKLPANGGPTLAQLEAIGVQVGIPVKTAAEWYSLRKQKSLLAKKKAAAAAQSSAGGMTQQQQQYAVVKQHQAPQVQQSQVQYYQPQQQQQQPKPQLQQQSHQQSQPQPQKRTVKKNGPKEAPGWGNKNGAKTNASRKAVLGQRNDNGSGSQQNGGSSSSGFGSGRSVGYEAQLEKWFVNHKTGFPSGKEVDRLMKMTSKSRDWVVEWCKNRRRTKVEKMQTCLVSDIQTAILEHWFVTNRQAIAAQSINQPLLTNR